MCCGWGFYSRAATNNVFTVYLTIFLVSKHSSSSQSIQLVQLAIPEIKFSVWARFLARSARAKLGSAQLTKLKIWKSSAQLSSPFERGQLSSARSLAKNFRLVSPLIARGTLKIFTCLTIFLLQIQIQNKKKILIKIARIKNSMLKMLEIDVVLLIIQCSKSWRSVFFVNPLSLTQFSKPFFDIRLPGIKSMQQSLLCIWIIF